MNKTFIYQILPNLLISPNKIRFVNKNGQEFKRIDNNYQILSAKKRALPNHKQLLTFMLDTGKTRGEF